MKNEKTISELINEKILEKFNLKVVEQTSSWIEYSDGLKVLFVDKDYFHYYFNSSEIAVPVTPDIVVLVDIIRDQILHIKPEYNVFTKHNTKDENINILNGDE